MHIEVGWGLIKFKSTIGFLNEIRMLLYFETLKKPDFLFGQIVLNEVLQIFYCLSRSVNTLY